MPTWLDEFIKNYGSNALIVGVILFFLGLFLRELVPWLLRQIQRGGEALFAFASGRGADYKFERAYLDWMIQRNMSLGLLPSNIAANVPSAQGAELEKVFVELRLTGTGQSEPREDTDLFILDQRMGRMYRPRGLWRFVPERFRPEPKQYGSELGRTLEQFPRLVIRGDPGSGKTTLLKYLAVTCARARRNKPREGDARNLVRERLGWKTRPFPIFVSLGRQSDVLGWGKTRTLLDAFQDEFARQILVPCPPDFFKHRLERGDCIVLLDAFDELGSPGARQAMAEHVAGLLNAYGERKNRFLATTRKVGYEGQLGALGFAEQTVQPLTPRDSVRLVEQLYRAYAIRDGVGEAEARKKFLERDYAERAARLKAVLNRNTRLRDLAENPLLLSLIVLVHSVRLEFPEERHILYRDCVEILTERWRDRKKGELQLASARRDELNLEQKIILLRALALEIQQQRSDGSEGQVPLLRTRAERIIADHLPNLIPALLPAEPNARYLACVEKAQAWLEGVKQESGILREIGTDKETGEGLVTFSHLTFQEYLAADALSKTLGVPTPLLDSLANPVWEEVTLLYMAMPPHEHANFIAEQLLHSPRAASVFTAARALTEKVMLQARWRDETLERLQHIARARETTDGVERARAAELMNELALSQFVPTLVAIVDTDSEFRVRLAAAQALGKLGDPRNFDEMLDVPAGEFLYGDEKRAEKIEQPFRIAKYLVTNQQYKKFVDAMQHAVPGFEWDETTRSFAPARSNYPVRGVSWHDAVAYCEWLSQTTKRKFRLPTEQEWERAARGTDGRKYPWGDEFEKQKANTRELGLGGTSPVGIFLEGASPCGALDMCGNVWEWTSSDYDKDTKVLRGGSFIYDSDDARAAGRYYSVPRDRYNDDGFRVAESFR